MAFDPNYGVNVGGHRVAYDANGAALTSDQSAATTYADAAAIQAIASTTRTDGMLVIKLDDSTEWIFDAESSASATAWVLVPDAGSGRWLRKGASTADLASTAAGYGTALIGDEVSAGTLKSKLDEIGSTSQPTAKTQADATHYGVSKLSLAPAVASTPIAVGDNDTRLPGYWKTAATQTASWSLAIDTLYILNTTNTAATATLPAIAAANDGHRVGMFNAGTTAAVWTPASGDTVGGTAASDATLAGPAAGTMKTLVANLATRRWIPLA